ncbi:nuclear transport factor 2 family protein [Rhodonellum sp.]|uniref:nuclear transport factor 2 family protein n=1 Tax=Rhodonellum sp. TaxID=2231180 RepID=UPI002720FB9C|nr:nuclear transport factor 2 family protein [Rhodonellum sp.]MDO9553425.1 nuclear transport factor 2 family protein [Rhodonellum sp.]
MKISCLVIVLLLSTLFCHAQESDSEILQIEKTIHLYFEGMMERDKSKLEAAFDPSARLIGYRGENFTVTDFESWAKGTAIGSPRAQELFENRILAIEIKGYTAMAKTELFWPGIYYFDYLTLIKIDEKWKIVHKTWYEEKR